MTGLERLSPVSVPREHIKYDGVTGAVIIGGSARTQRRSNSEKTYGTRRPTRPQRQANC